MSIESKQRWLGSSLGIYLQTHEQKLFDEAVVDIFGFNAMQVGMSQLDLLRNSRIPHRFKTDSSAGEVFCEADQLPLTANSIDLLLLPHVIEFSRNPHQTLREAERVLVPEGHVLITCFNPLSSWGIKRLLTARNEYPWQGSFFSLLRIKDWLALLGFEVVSVQMICHALPVNSPGWFRRLYFLHRLGSRCWGMMGGVYFIVAKKRVVGMRLIRPNWQKSKLKPSFVAAPSQKTDKQKIQHGQ